MVIDLTSYKTASRLSPHINAGASARLNRQPMVSDLSGEAHAAFCHGWRTTDEAENRAGRTIQAEARSALGNWVITPCQVCFGLPNYCHACMALAATSMVGG